MDFILSLIIFLILACSIGYIVRAKKKGVKCIGCSAGASCSGCSTNCSSETSEESQP